ncbi:hypothetical protein [Nocardioides kribbensis]|uniref:hypothetical protein n=1 Tax=Nocardioides kribbensis TaxID=305517 RepID=UPI0018799DF7|nr:hypothetical protein [Nocardioides kribbensis]
MTTGGRSERVHLALGDGSSGRMRAAAQAVREWHLRDELDRATWEPHDWGDD